MGINFSRCCSCSFFLDEKLSQSIHSDTERPRIEISPEEVCEKLQKAKQQLMNYFLIDDLYSGESQEFKIVIEETPKGHMLKVKFNIPVDCSRFCEFLDKTDRKTWDKLIESAEKLEVTKDYSVVYLRYKSQISYSGKEVVVASCREATQSGVLGTFVSVPCDKINNAKKVEVFEGGYKVSGGEQCTVDLAIHMNVGGTALTKLFQKISEKIISDVLKKLIELLSEE